jgi:hypothetical protein
MDLIAPPLCVRCRLGLVIELADLNIEVSEKQPDIDIEIHSVSVSGCLGLSVVISYMLHVTGTCVFLSCPSRAEAEPDWPLYQRLGVIIVGCHSLLPTLYEHQMLVWGPPAGYRHRDALNVGSRLLGVVCGFILHDNTATCVVLCVPTDAEGRLDSPKSPIVGVNIDGARGGSPTWT